MNFWLLKIRKTDQISDNEKKIMKRRFEKYLTGLEKVLQLYSDYISVQKQLIKTLWDEDADFLLVISNGHGEDLVASKIISSIFSSFPGIDIKVYPLVGLGDVFSNPEYQNKVQVQ